MKQLIMLMVAIIAITTQARAVTQQYFSGSCEWPSAVAQWFTVVEFDDVGLPVRASGICCDGSAWTLNLLTYYGAGSAVNATLHSADNIAVSVSADRPVDFRIVDLRTGNYVSPVHHYVPSGQLEINISTLPAGVYGVAVSQDGAIFKLLTFAKLQ